MKNYPLVFLSSLSPDLGHVEDVAESLEKSEGAESPAVHIDSLHDLEDGGVQNKAD